MCGTEDKSIGEEDACVSREEDGCVGRMGKR